MNRTNRLLCGVLLVLGVSVTTFARIPPPPQQPPSPIQGANGVLPSPRIPGVPDRWLETSIHSRNILLDGTTIGAGTFFLRRSFSLSKLEVKVTIEDKATRTGNPCIDITIQNRWGVGLRVIDDPRYFTLPEELRPSMKDAWGSGILDLNRKDSFFGFHPEFLHKTPEETLELVFSETPVELYKEIPKEKRRLYGVEGVSIMFIPQWMFSSARNDVVRKLSEPNFQVRYMEKYGLENLKLALYNLGKFKVADIPLMIRHIPD